MGIFQAMADMFGRPQVFAAETLPQPPRQRFPASVRRYRQGGAGTQIHGGTIASDDYNTDVAGYKWYGEPGSIGIARKMEKDPHVFQALMTKRAPLQAAMWDFEPASQDEIDVEVADFCRWVFFELNNWDRVIERATCYMRDGFSLLEVTDDVCRVPIKRFPKHPGGGRGVSVTGFHHIPAWTVKFWNQSPADPNKLKSITQWLVSSDQEPGGFKEVSADRLLRFTQEQEGANFEGLSYLRRAYGAWKVKQTLILLDAIRHERMGIPVPTITMPEDYTEEDFDRAEEILLELRAHEKAYMALPFGYTFEWSAASVSDGTAFGEAIERCNRDIAFVVGAGFQLLGLSGKTGSYALAQTQEGQYEIQLEGDSRFIANVFNLGTDGWSIVERLVRFNYGEEPALPRLVARNMPTRDWSKILPVIHNLTMSKHITADDRLESFIRSVLYLPSQDPETARGASTAGEVKQERNPPQPIAEPSDADEADDPEDQETDEEPDDTEEVETDE